MGTAKRRLVDSYKASRLAAEREDSAENDDGVARVKDDRWVVIVVAVTGGGGGGVIKWAAAFLPASEGATNGKLATDESAPMSRRRVSTNAAVALGARKVFSGGKWTR